MTVCDFYQRNRCKFGGKQSDAISRQLFDVKQIPANLSTLEVREMQPKAEVALVEAPTTTVLVLSTATAIAPVIMAHPTHLRAIAIQTPRPSA
jgi:hypothetical protein